MFVLKHSLPSETVELNVERMISMKNIICLVLQIERRKEITWNPKQNWSQSNKSRQTTLLLKSSTNGKPRTLRKAATAALIWLFNVKFLVKNQAVMIQFTYNACKMIRLLGIKGTVSCAHSKHAAIRSLITCRKNKFTGTSIHEWNLINAHIKTSGSCMIAWLAPPWSRGRIL